MTPEDQTERRADGQPADEPSDGQPVVRPEDPAEKGQEEAPEEAPPERSVTELRRPSTIGGILYLCVLAVALFGIGLAATGAWRAGVTWLGGALLAAGGARIVLGDDEAGMLRVRRKWVDAGILLFLGAALIFLALTIPDQPT